MIDNESMLIDKKDENENTNVIFRLAIEKSINMKIIAAKKRVTVNSLYNEGVDHILEKYGEFYKDKIMENWSNKMTGGRGKE